MGKRLFGLLESIMRFFSFDLWAEIVLSAALWTAWAALTCTCPPLVSQAVATL